MPVQMTAPRVASAVETNVGLLVRFIQAYWLRPENALWMTLRSRALSRVPFAGPCMDVSCGDGIFSFLHCGGVLHPDFDVFTSVENISPAAQRHADMFDSVSDCYRPVILSPPTQHIDHGTDNKPSMLVKARQLSLYESLVEHDNNQPLPFPDDAFQTIYCNAAYWVTRIDQFLSELRRVTRHDGRIVLQVKLSSVRDFTLEARRAVLGDRLLDILDRGRSACWPTLADRKTWEKRFRSAGLTIIDGHPFVTKTHAHVWDLGLRPIAPMLVKMTSALTAQSRSSIKREWVDLFGEILEPLCREDLDLFNSSAGPAEIQYVLTPTAN